MGDQPRTADAANEAHANDVVRLLRNLHHKLIRLLKK